MPIEDDKLEDHVDPDKVGDDKPTEDAKPDKPDESGTTYSITVGGEKQEVTLEELQSLATKAAGADKKFEEAAQIRKDSEAGAKLMEMFSTIKSSDEAPDENVYKELLRTIGYKDTEIPDYETVFNKKGGTPVDKDDKKPDATVDKVTLEGLAPEVREVIEAARESKLQDVREKIFKNTEKGVDKDKILGKMIIDTPTAEKSAVQEALYDMAKKEVQRRILGNEPFSSELITSVLQGIRGKIKVLGMPTKSAGRPPMVGSGPSTDYSPEVIADKPIERVDSEDAVYIDNVVKRALQRQYKRDNKRA